MRNKEIFVLLDSDYDGTQIKGCFSTLEKCLKFVTVYYDCKPVLDKSFENIERIYLRDETGFHIGANIVIEKRILDEKT